MLKKLTYKVAWLLATLFFLLIAWATSDDEPLEINNLPVIASAEEQYIWVKNESADSLQQLTLVLNSIFTYEGVTLAPAAEMRLQISDFTDRNQQPFPQAEKPYRLEIFSNGAGELYDGGYTIIHFD